MAEPTFEARVDRTGAILRTLERLATVVAPAPYPRPEEEPIPRARALSLATRFAEVRAQLETALSQLETPGVRGDPVRAIADACPELTTVIREAARLAPTQDTAKQIGRDVVALRDRAVATLVRRAELQWPDPSRGREAPEPASLSADALARFDRGQVSALQDSFDDILLWRTRTSLTVTETEGAALFDPMALGLEERRRLLRHLETIQTFLEQSPVELERMPLAQL